MHGSSVLLALQEQTKWRERKKRLEERLRQIRARKRYFLKELETAQQKVAAFGASLVDVEGDDRGPGRVPRPDRRGAEVMTALMESAQREFERWRLREREIVDTLRDLDEEENRLLGEIAKVDQQVTYYEDLARDMKREMGPAKLSSLLTFIGRGR